MFMQRIIVKKVFFCISPVQHKLFCFAATLWFISLNRIFIWLFNDIRLKCILQIPYFALSKSGSCATQPLRGVV